LATYDLLADLPLEVEGYALERLQSQLGPFTRVCTVVRLQGGGQEGLGEDVIYDAADHDALHAAGPVLPLAGTYSLRSFGQHLAELDLFPTPATREDYRRYRRWAFDSAALDLALRQAGQPLHAVLDREPRPVRFVASVRLGDPATTAPVRRRREIAPGLHFKLDPENNWTDQLIDELVELDCVDTLDLKGLYRGTPVDVKTDPWLYRRCAEAFPGAWLEDPDLSHQEAASVLEPHRDRITWDANLHSVADIEDLPFPPRAINSKPSRFGPLEELLAVYDLCAHRGIQVYGGGQGELGPGRGQAQYLASLFHPDGPNDVAPSPYNLPDPPPDLPNSPLPPAPGQTGFRWGQVA
jgi:L-alanine-DL-glutamate epimerase-like enolase superfamily enzyme